MQDFTQIVFLFLPTAGACPVNTHPGANTLLFSLSLLALYPSLQCSGLDSMPNTIFNQPYSLENASAASALTSGNMRLRCLNFGPRLTSVVHSIPALKLCLVPCISLRVRLYSRVSWVVSLPPSTSSLRNNGLLDRFMSQASVWVMKLFVAPGSFVTSANLSAPSRGAHTGIEYSATMLSASVLTVRPLAHSPRPLALLFWVCALIYISEK